MSSTRHTIYVVSRPVNRLQKHLSSAHEWVSSNLAPLAKNAADIGTAMALGVTSHRAVVIESNYYHLVRMQDDTLGLDLTPFSDDSTFMKVPVSKTSLSHAKRLEIAVTVISEMTHNKIPPQSVRVLTGSHESGHSKWPNVFAMKAGDYSMFSNNCITFCCRFLEKLINSNNHRDRLVINKELMEEYLTKDRLKNVANWWHGRDDHFAKLVERLLNAEIKE